MSESKNDEFELLEDTMLKMQLEKTEAMKVNLFYAHLRKKPFKHSEF